MLYHAKPYMLCYPKTNHQTIDIHPAHTPISRFRYTLQITYSVFQCCSFLCKHYSLYFAIHRCSYTHTHTKTHIKQEIIHIFLVFSMCTLCWTFFPLSTNRVFYRTFNIYTNTQYTHKLTKRNLNTKDPKSLEQPPKTYTISKLPTVIQKTRVQQK